MTIEKNIYDFFKKEHDSLIALFKTEFKNSQNSRNWKPLLLICEKWFENNHHAKEELYLFDSLKENIKIRSGGPMCTFYFDSHLSNPTLQRAMALVKKTTGLDYKPEWSNQMIELRKKNLPLVIPGEDHEAGRIILRAIEDLITNASENPETLFEKSNYYLKPI